MIKLLNLEKGYIGPTGERLSHGIQTGINRAAEPYGLIIGGRGSAQQLVINTVLLQGNPQNQSKLSESRKVSARL